ncbi:hypothetical protein BU16DRAFT_587044 [Lophium mytilinum]|uniref:SET domain-containing protein n=1 Tax=Lophium mytilinum TaxID=390894 RepID=A0A6A6Q8C6_9PEZI|nr:hypothetical protein BU16DRAFT_587044 [Lophium mytilinum]
MANVQPPRLYNIGPAASIPGQQCMVANRLGASIDIGEAIISEAPLVHMRVGVLIRNFDFNTWMKRPTTRPKIQRKFDGLTPAQQIAFLGLHPTGPGATVQQKFFANAFSEESRYTLGENPTPLQRNVTSLLVFEEISMINHSCLPNAVFAWDSERGLATVHATQQIPHGQEILIEYDCDMTFLPAATRTPLILQELNFQCVCPLCTAAINTADSDNRRTQLQVLDTAIDTAWRHYRAGTWQTNVTDLEQKQFVPMVNEYYNLLEAERIMDIRLVDALVKAATISQNVFRHKEKAIELLLKAIYWCVTAYGDTGYFLDRHDLQLGRILRDVDMTT